MSTINSHILKSKQRLDAHIIPCSMQDILVDDKELYAYLGYGDNYLPDEYMLEFIGELKKEATEICKPKLGYRDVAGERIDREFIRLEDTQFSPNGIISHAFKESERFIILLASVGEELDKWLHDKRENGDVMEGYISDALGSTIVEAVVAYALPYLENLFAESDMRITNSYSPGYCGWHVSEQQKLFSLLPEKFCGITLTDSSLMLPIKSVSAVIGVGRNVKRVAYGCAICKKQDCYKRNLGKNK